MVGDRLSSANEHELGLLDDKETKDLFLKFGLKCDLTAPSEDSVSATHFDLLKGHPLVIELIANIR
jgi:hypothetical protein